MRPKWYLVMLFALLFSGYANAQNTLDKVGLSSSAPASVAYSLRLVSTTYTGPLVRVKVGSYFYDVYPNSGSNNFSLSSKISASISTYNAAVASASANDLSTIITGSTNATVAIWYDQSGNGIHVFSSSATAKIITAGSINTLNGQPTIYFNGSGSSLISTATVNYSSQTNATVNAVAQDVASIDYISGVISTGINGGWGLNYDPTSTIKGYWVDASGSWGANSNENYTVPKIITGLIGTTTNSSLYINSQLKTTKGYQPISNGTADYIYIGIRGNASNRIFIGNISEVFLFPKNLSSTEQSALESNQSIFIQPAVTITSSVSGSISAGTTVTFTATPLNYTTPTYQWYKNGTAISGATGNVYTTSSLSNNDIIKAVVVEGSPSVSTSGLVMNLDAGNSSSYSSGSTWTDLTGRGNNGTLNSVTYSSSNQGSLAFDGTSSNVSLPNSTDFNFDTGDFSVEFWAKHTGANTKTPNFIAINSNNNFYSSVRIGWFLNAGNSTVAFSHSTNGTSWAVQTGFTGFDLSNWSQIVLTRSAGIVTMYANGVNKGTYSLPGSLMSTTTSNPTYNQLGTLPNYQSVYTLLGNMSVIRYYKGAGLTSSQVVNNFNTIGSRYGLNPIGYTSNSITASVVSNNTITLTSAAGTNSQTTCINTAINSITYSTTGATGATFSGLPSGVSGSWSNNMVTISGTPTASGTSTYTVTLTGGYGSISASGSIVVKATNTLALTSASGTNSQAVCENSTLTNITYATTGATGATFSTLPAGLTGTWSNNVVTISGTPTVAGTYTYTINLTGGCGTISATGSITVNPTNTISLSSATGTNAQTLCSTASLSNITYNTTGATGASFSGLPAGVSGSWSNNVVTISGTPTAAGNYTYTVTLTGGCGTITATGSIVATSMTVSISSSAAGNTICNGDLVTFTATVQNACVTPFFQWYKNGTAISGATSSTYSSTTLSNSDQITVSCSNTPSIVNDNSLALWLDAGLTASYSSGTTWRDLSGNNRHATLNYGASFDASTGSIVTNGIDQYISVPLFNSGSTNMTMQTWVYINANSHGGFMANGDAAYSIGIGSNVSGEMNSNGDQAWMLFSSVRYINTNTTYPTGWHLVTMTMDNNSKPSYYLDGSIVYTSPSGSNPNSPSGSFYLGAVPGDGSKFYNGKFAAAYFYNRELTASEIEQNYTASAGRFGLSGSTNISYNTITTTVTANNTVTLSSAAGTNSQTVCINTAINSITYSTTGATGVTFSGLPAGVSGTWSTNVVTISGTPSVAGTYTYTVNLTGGCGTISATGSIVVNPDNTIALSSATGTDGQTLCKNTTLTNITYATTGATGASFSGLPAGVSGAWSNNVVTLSGTPSFVGTYTYTVTLTGGCSSISTTGTITVNSSSISITSSAAGQNICKGDLVTFTSTVLNGGSNLSYQWYANGNAIIGANSDSYSSTSISNGDQIYVNFASSCTVGQSGSITTSGLKFNYDAGNSSSYTSGTTWRDISGNNTNAAFQSTPNFISSPIKTFQWNTRGNNGSNSTKATLNNVLGDDMTVGAWIKTTNVGNNPAHYRLLYILTSEAGGGANDWGFGIDNSGKLAFGAGPNDVTHATNAAVNTGNWTYVAATREKSTGLIKLYINGAFDKSGTGNSGNTLNAQSTIVIADGNDGPAYTFEGNIAIVEGYNKVLTVNEILSNYNANASRFGYLGGTSINSNTITTTVTSITLSSAAGSDAKSTCVNTAMGNITYATTGVTAASVSGLPAGLTGNWANDVYTISGTPTETGTFTYTVTLSGGCNGNITASGTITVNPTNVIALTSIAASTSQTLCINTALSSITYSSTSATGATYSGLPAGVNGSYSNGIVTISGTPTASGTFNYTVLLTGGCGNVTATGTIIVTPNNTITLSSATGTDNAQTPCLNNPITTITYTTARATDATVSGLPAGVTGVWSNNVFTIAGTPTESGTFNYTITLIGGCGVITKTGTITVKPNNTIALTSASATSAQTLCFNNSAITTINYSTTTATGATYNGFPAGINTSWSGNVVTISGTPTASGTYTYTVTTSGGCVNTSLNGTIIVKALPVIQLSIVGDGCADKTSLIATTGLTSYAWYKDNVVVNGAASGTFTPSAAGVYKVQVSDGACSNTSTTTTISTCGLTAEGKTMPTATSTTLVSIEGATNNGTGVNVAGKKLDITVTNSINIIETPTNGGSLVLNLDARNLNSLSHSANPGTWYDLSGNHNDATVYGSLAFGTGNGGAMNFPGGNANYAQAKNGVYFNGSSFTIQSWVYPVEILNWNRIIDFGNGAGSNNILLSNSYGTSGAPGLYIEGGQFQANTTLTLNAWHFVCATFDLTTRIATIYVDGQPSGTRTMSPPVNIIRTNNYIGRSNWGFGDPNFHGGIGSIQIYNGYLTAAEILSNYNSTKSLYGIQ